MWSRKSRLTVPRRCNHWNLLQRKAQIQTVSLRNPQAFQEDQALLFHKLVWKKRVWNVSPFVLVISIPWCQHQTMKITHSHHLRLSGTKSPAGSCKLNQQFLSFVVSWRQSIWVNIQKTKSAHYTIAIQWRLKLHCHRRNRKKQSTKIPSMVKTYNKLATKRNPGFKEHEKKVHC